MNLMQFLKVLMLTALLLSPLAAEEVDAASKCDIAYDACLAKCDAAQESSEKCYAECDAAQEKCLSLAQGDEPEQKEQKEGKE